jgi:hypothetical protein
MDFGRVHTSGKDTDPAALCSQLKPPSPDPDNLASGFSFPDLETRFRLRGEKPEPRTYRLSGDTWPSIRFVADWIPALISAFS